MKQKLVKIIVNNDEGKVGKKPLRKVGKNLFEKMASERRPECHLC